MYLISLKYMCLSRKKMILVLVYECLNFLQKQFLSATQVIIIDTIITYTTKNVMPG